MRFLRDAAGCRRAARTAIFLVLLTGLAACGDSRAARDASDSTIGLVRLLTGADQPDPDELEVDPGAPPPAAPRRCPQVVVREGTETYRVYERGHEGDPAYVVYQGGVSRVARECAFTDNAVRIEFGVAGRVITGPKGGSGSFELPLRAAFVKTGGEPVWTQLYRVPATVLPGETMAQFVHVENNLYYELPPGEDINDYVIYVGFDDLAGAQKRG